MILCFNKNTRYLQKREHLSVYKIYKIYSLRNDLKVHNRTRTTFVVSLPQLGCFRWSGRGRLHLLLSFAVLLLDEPLPLKHLLSTTKPDIMRILTTSKLFFASAIDILKLHLLLIIIITTQFLSTGSNTAVEEVTLVDRSSFEGGGISHVSGKDRDQQNQWNQSKSQK